MTYYQSSAMPVIFSAIERLPLLHKDEEISLGKVVQAGRIEGATPRQQRAAARARDRMIKCNIRLVVSMVKKYNNFSAGLGRDDLFQEGMIGLSTAVDKFDPERGYKFSTYAYWWIKQSIIRAFNNHSLAIRVPCHTREKRGRFAKFIARYGHEHKRTPTLSEIADHFKMTVDEVAFVFGCFRHPASLEAPSGNNEDSCLHEVLPGSYTNDVEDVCMYDYDKLQMCISLLTPLEQMVVNRALLSDQPCSLATLAAEVGVSRERMRQVKDKALVRLRVRYHGSKDAPAGHGALHAMVDTWLQEGLSLDEVRKRQILAGYSEDHPDFIKRQQLIEHRRQLAAGAVKLRSTVNQSVDRLRAMEPILTACHERGESLRQMARSLGDAGFTSATGGLYRHSQIINYLCRLGLKQSTAAN